MGLQVDDYPCKGPFHEDSVGSFLVKVQKYLKCRCYIVPVTEQSCAGWNLGGFLGEPHTPEFLPLANSFLLTNINLRGSCREIKGARFVSASRRELLSMQVPELVALFLFQIHQAQVLQHWVAISFPNTGYLDHHNTLWQPWECSRSYYYLQENTSKKFFSCGGFACASQERLQDALLILNKLSVCNQYCHFRNCCTLLVWEQGLVSLIIRNCWVDVILPSCRHRCSII